MAETDFIVAIELGSTKITGVAGRKNADGSIRVLAYAEESAADCIKRGIISNIDKTTQGLTSVLKQLEEKLDAGIRKVYVGIGGQSMRSSLKERVKQLGEDTKVSQALIDSLAQENREMPLPWNDYEIIATAQPVEYKIGNTRTTEPVGIVTEQLQAYFLNIIGRNTLKRHIRQCFRQAGPGYEIADYFIGSVKTAEAVLTENEKRSGCVLVDFGAETTTVAIYQNNLLRHLAVIPLGGRNVTKDIASLHIEEKDAEELKKRYAKAYTEAEENEDDSSQDKTYVIDDKCSIKEEELQRIVEARMQEIVDNVKEQIVHSAYGGKLLAGAILTGGGANMPEVETLFAHVTQIEKVRRAQGTTIPLMGVAVPKDGRHNTVLGILNSGKDNCCKVDPRQAQRDMFKEQEAEKRRAEEDKRLAEENKRLDEWQRVFNSAMALRNEGRYDEALLQLAQLNSIPVAGKEPEVNMLRNEIERAKEREKRAQLRLEEFEKLLQEAAQLKEEKKYREALAKLTDARTMNIPGREEDIRALEKEITQKRKETSIFGKLRKKVEDTMMGVYDTETKKEDDKQ